jgi:hypothetical protein
MADMDVDVDMPVVAPKKEDSKERFEVKKVCAHSHKLRFFMLTHRRAVECGGLVGVG